MQRKIYVWLPVLLAIFLVFANIGCSTSSSDENTPSLLGGDEQIAENPNRAVARPNEPTVIRAPRFLFDDPSSSIRAAAATATFAIHPDDAHIAEIVSQDGSTCTVIGRVLGSVRIIITVGNRSTTVIMAVTPADFYVLPADKEVRLGERVSANAWWNSDYPDWLPSDHAEYTMEPTYQLAWKWRNPPTRTGASASGIDCGFDIMAYYVDPSDNGQRGWVKTTYDYGGWHYYINENADNMVNGVQVEGDLKLELKPEFVYYEGTPYLQITHTLTNTGSTPLTGQKFAATADTQIWDRDDCPLYHKDYGVLMTNEYIRYSYDDDYNESRTVMLPTMRFRLVCQNVPGRVNNVSTIWLGRYSTHRNLENVYANVRNDIPVADSVPDTGMAFSYQGIDLAPGESKDFVIWFTQIQ